MKTRNECALFAQSANANEIKKRMWSARSTANNSATTMQITNLSVLPPALMKLTFLVLVLVLVQEEVVWLEVEDQRLPVFLVPLGYNI